MDYSFVGTVECPFSFKGQNFRANGTSVSLCPNRIPSGLGTFVPRWPRVAVNGGGVDEWPLMTFLPAGGQALPGEK